MIEVAGHIKEGMPVMDRKQERAAVKTGKESSFTGRETDRAAEESKQGEYESALERVKETVGFLNRNIRIEIDNDLGIAIIKVVDSETDKVIRQIPAEEMLKLSRNAEELKGLLIDTEG